MKMCSKIPGRRIRPVFIQLVLLVTFLFNCILIILLGTQVFDNHNNNMSNAFINTCEISICTPCQEMGPGEEQKQLETNIKDAVFFTQYKHFPPEKTSTLESFTELEVPRIETVIHQKWNTEELPIQFKEYVTSFLDNHLSWQYIFWTDKSTRKFVKDHYPNFLFMYDNYVHPLNRADSIRYMILFYYGGVYADLDMKSLRPLDPMIKKYSCFLAQEPHVHSIVYSNFYEQASNGLMACRKRHPFMKTVLENLSNFFYYAHVLDSTGPRFLTFSYKQYIRNKSESDITDDDYVYLSPPEYFLPTVDPGVNGLLAMQCKGTLCLSPLRQWQCEQWRQEGIRSTPYVFSFTTHFWAHAAYKDMTSWKYIHISKLRPGRRMYEYKGLKSGLQSI